MAKKAQSASIAEIQGSGSHSPLGKCRVRTRGVVIATSRRGFFLQDPAGKPDAETSCGIFVLSRKHRPSVGSLCEVEGVVFDYLSHEFDRPVTEIKAVSVKKLDSGGPSIEPVWLNAKTLPDEPLALAAFLNAHEGMLVGIESGAVFIAPSNPFADYVLAPHDLSETVVRSEHGGVLIDHDLTDRWYPSFRIVDYDQAMAVDVGTVLEKAVAGGLNYRSSAWQVAVNGAAQVKPGPEVVETVSQLTSKAGCFTVMTLNALNLDIKLESAEKVMDPRRDIDDDLGEGRFLRLARAIVKQARSPDIIALQEIQDNDGAELSDVVDASETYGELIRSVAVLGGPQYSWLDIAPQVGADGGQPGGNIRNGFLYNAKTVRPIAETIQLIAAKNAAFEDSRKPLTATFSLASDDNVRLTVINVHLASKRHQRGMFAPELPGFDGKEGVRIEQAQLISKVLLKLDEIGSDYYLTGDFNDTEYSQTLKAMLDGGRVNVVEMLPVNERYDYNHRGKLQVLMHGIVSARQSQQGRVEYEILHGNELKGVQPGDGGGKASDHAYTVARLSGKK